MAGQLLLGKNTIGVGDRFAHQAEAQLRACILAVEQGVEVFPVWNKSNREHNIIGSEPASIRAAADAAVLKLGWTKPYYIDADHINFEERELFPLIETALSEAELRALGDRIDDGLLRQSQS